MNALRYQHNANVPLYMNILSKVAKKTHKQAARCRGPARTPTDLHLLSTRAAFNAIHSMSTWRQRCGRSRGQGPALALGLAGPRRY
jgi:hypothetical protein